MGVCLSLAYNAHICILCPLGKIGYMSLLQKLLDRYIDICLIRKMRRMRLRTRNYFMLNHRELFYKKKLSIIIYYYFLFQLRNISDSLRENDSNSQGRSCVERGATFKDG